MEHSGSFGYYAGAE